MVEMSKAVADRIQANKEAAAQQEIFEPALTSLTPDPSGMPEDPSTSSGESVLGEAPAPQMAAPSRVDMLMTDITLEEMKAGQKAAETYAKRRQAEIDYGKNFAARRSAKISP